MLRTHRPVAALRSRAPGGDRPAFSPPEASARAAPPPRPAPPDIAALAVLPGPEVLRRLDSTPQGLTPAEAARRLRCFGRNELPVHRDHHLLGAFLHQFTHLMAALLWVGAAIAFLIELPQLGFAITVVILINGAFSFWQEYRAEKATVELARLLPHVCSVVRAGATLQVPTAEVVPGDLLVLSEGDNIPADGRVLEAHAFTANNAALTGESVPVPLDPAPLEHAPPQPAEAHNCVFAGTLAASGRALVVVTTTGADTLFGRIAGFTQQVVTRPSPLQRELDRAVRAISLVAIGVGLAFALPAWALVGLDAAGALTFALGLIVAFVPEGLLPTLTLSLAMAVQRMARRRAVVKHLPAVEALGASTVIATDKTGVLTENRMSVVALFTPDGEFEVNGAGYTPVGEFRRDRQPLSPSELEPLHPLFRAAALCNYARLHPPAASHLPWEITGDPTEGALQTLAARGGVRVEELLQRRRLAAEWPFDPRRQRMTVAYPRPDGLIALSKGSPAAMLERCDRLRTAAGVQPLTPPDREQLLAAGARFARRGLRVLALAERPIGHDELDYADDRVEQHLTFLGLAAMHDPPRAEVRDAVARCRSAGIRTIVVSGDQGPTVAAIAQQVGIVASDTPRVVEGAELMALPEAGLRALLDTEKEVVFARTPPEGKLRVVQALQASGHVVAVTGDGVNDAPALRQADIGVAMGLSGTDVARAAADVVLTDDNFASIVAAVEEGRAVFDNIRNFTTYCFTSNAAEALPFVLFLLTAGKIPLALPIMLVLAVDLGTDMFPALGLGAERAEPDVMSRPPRRRGTHLLSGALLLRSLLWLGLLEGVAGMASFWAVSGGSADPELLPRARAATFAGIVVAQVANVLVCRSERGPAFGRGWNPLLAAGVVLELLILQLVVYHPALQATFGTAALRPDDWSVPLLAFPAFLIAEESRKLLIRRRMGAD